jgi:hypothetical protein
VNFNAKLVQFKAPTVFLVEVFLEIQLLIATVYKVIMREMMIVQVIV